MRESARAIGDSALSVAHINATLRTVRMQRAGVCMVLFKYVPIHFEFHNYEYLITCFAKKIRFQIEPS